MTYVDNRPRVPCKWCGTPTPMLGTKMCDGCWELEHRIIGQPELALRMVKTYAPELLGVTVEITS